MNKFINRQKNLAIREEQYAAPNPAGFTDALKARAKDDPKLLLVTDVV